MSLLGKDFEDAMRQLTRTLVEAQQVIANLADATARLNAILDKVSAVLK